MVLGALLAACAPSVSVASLNGGSKVRSPSTSVEVFTNRSLVKKPYDEIALITVNDRGYSNIPESTLIADLVKKAKALGADGIILLSRTVAGDGGTVVYGTYVQSNERTYQAVAFVYK